MSRRTELEEEYKIAQDRITNALADTPKEVLEDWTKELDSIAFELNNLHGDMEIQDQED